MPFIEFPWDTPRALEVALFCAFGGPETSAVLKTRGRLARPLPARRTPRLRSGPRRPTYPQGCRVKEFGPQLDTPPTEPAHPQAAP